MIEEQLPIALFRRIFFTFSAPSWHANFSCHFLYGWYNSCPTKQHYPCTHSAFIYLQCIEVELPYFFVKCHFVSAFVFDLQGKTCSLVLVLSMVTCHLVGIPVERSWLFLDMNTCICLCHGFSFVMPCCCCLIQFHYAMLLLPVVMSSCLCKNFRANDLGRILIIKCNDKGIAVRHVVLICVYCRAI